MPQWLVDYLNEALDSAQFLCALALDLVGTALSRAGQVAQAVKDKATLVQCPGGHHHEGDSE